MNGSRDPAPRYSREARDGYDSHARRPARDDFREHSERDRGDRDRGDRDRGERQGDRSRRYRSRSPHRRPPRGGRDFDHDSYRSSRDLQERERENRFRERQEGRAWDRERERDRGYRRDGRRDDNDRPPRRDRDRDLMADHRPRRNEQGFREDRERERRRSASPITKPREPTPDLTDVVPVLQRRRRQTAWDIKPPGFEHTSAIMAKEQAGFAAPGSSRAQVEDAAKMRAFMNQSSDVSSGSGLDPVNSRQAKRLIVRNLPPGTSKDAIQSFINLQLDDLNVVSGKSVCVSVFLNPSKNFAILDFKTSEDATVALSLDGVQMQENATNGANGATDDSSEGLSIQRLKDYVVPGPSKESAAQDGVVGTVVRDTRHKISITNLPVFIDEEQLTELLASLGKLKSLAMAREVASGEARGFAFCEYVNPDDTDGAIGNLNGIDLGGLKIKLQRAHLGANQPVEPGQLNAGQLKMLATEQSPHGKSRVVVLSNVLSREELIRDDDYGEICEDISAEAIKYGEVEDIKIPRPQVGGRENNGVGKIYIGYKTMDAGEKAVKGLAGRKFNQRVVITSYMTEEEYEVGAW